MRTGTYRHSRPFLLESGESLPELRIAYETWGASERAAQGAVLVIHALTGSAHAAAGSGEAGWWEGLFLPGRTLDPARRFVVCANLPGSCYGSTGPADLPWGGGAAPAFPTLTTRDMARALKALLDHLQVPSLELVIGGSLGAMVAWELAVEFPALAAKVVAIAGTPQATPWTIAFNAVARQVIQEDPRWCGGRYEGEGPARGVALARQIAMISYRTESLFRQRFGIERESPGPQGALSRANRFQVETYLEHQGEKLARRFDARCYMALTSAMDLHDIGRDRGGLPVAMAFIRAEVLAVGVDTDVLFSPQVMREAVGALRAVGGCAAYAEISSPFGHDAFLVEHEALDHLLQGFLEGRRDVCAS